MYLVGGALTLAAMPAQRAAFQALAAAVTNFAQALGAGTAPFLLSLGPDGRLAGMDRIAGLAIGASWAVPLLLMRLDALLLRRHQPRGIEP